MSTATATAAPAPSGDRLLTPEETAELLGLKVQTIAKWRSTRSVNLPYVKCGHYVRYRRADVDEWIMSNRHTIDTSDSPFLGD